MSTNKVNKPEPCVPSSSKNFVIHFFSLPLHQCVKLQFSNLAQLSQYEIASVIQFLHEQNGRYDFLLNDTRKKVLLGTQVHIHQENVKYSSSD